MYLDRDLSWLSFNERVLQEAASPSVPLLERLNFLAIYSANLDEFYRVRVATIRRAMEVADQLDEDEMVYPPSELLQRIEAEVHRHLDTFGTVFQQVLRELGEQNWHLYQTAQVADEHLAGVQHYFRAEVLSFLQPTVVDLDRTYFLENRRLYLLFWLKNNADANHQLAYVNIPSDELPRFHPIADESDAQYFITLDDILRINYALLFPGTELVGSYSVLVNRDADLGIEDEYAGDLVREIRHRIKERERGTTVRFLYDEHLPRELLALVQQVFTIDTFDLIRGGRYHRMKDLFLLPTPDDPALRYQAQPPIHPQAAPADKLLREVLDERDLLLHFPYHSYDGIHEFFNEAAIDPNVTTIQATFYRIAGDSRIANALVSAARNGKQVEVFMEVKARFDEQNNLRWSEALEAVGARVHYSRPNLKVHAKAALVKRRVGEGIQKCYGILATGNFNEETARIYSDMALLTSHPEMMEDLDTFFQCLFNHEPTLGLKHLLVSPYDLQDQFINKIDREITAAKRGARAELLVKVNNLEDQVMIDRLYEAHRAGVKVTLMVRSICCLAPDVPGQSEGLRVVRTVDRYLEHVRAFYFYHGGEEEVYLASADWMRRNLYRRIELAFPVVDKALREQVKQILSFHGQDNTKAVHFTADYANEPVRNDQPPVRAQYATYEWLSAQEALRSSDEQMNNDPPEEMDTKNL